MLFRSSNNLCAAPSCTDTVKNGTETAIDCGGSCADCSDNQACTQNADCSNGVCTAGSCHPATCTDGVNSYTCACPAGYSGTNCQIIPTTACLAGVSPAWSGGPLSYLDMLRRGELPGARAPA